MYVSRLEGWNGWKRKTPYVCARGGKGMVLFVGGDGHDIHVVTILLRA